MATEKALLRFRCYNCNKLLGASASRAGKTTTCPNCKAELIVPEPENPERSALAEATRSLVPDLGEGPSTTDRRRDEDSPGPRHDPAFSWEEIDTAIFQAPGGPSPIDLPVSFAPAPDPKPEPEPEPVAVPAPEAKAEPEPPPILPTAPSAVPPVVPEISVDVGSSRSTRPRARRGDVVLSQSVIASWAAFMLLALAISFLAGLFVGHFVWSGR